jgi:predicted O-methyltransferase YrrM
LAADLGSATHERHTIKRLFYIGASVIVLCWVGFGVFFSFMSGGSPRGFLTGVIHAPLFTYETFGKVVRPGRVYAALADQRAVVVLKEAFGEGVRPSDGRLLHDTILRAHSRRILDVGTANGYSALWFALAAKETGGAVTTIEIDPHRAATARRNFERAGLGQLIRSYTNDALIQIPLLEGDYDFVFLDIGVPGINGKLLDLVRSRLAAGGIITAHNACAFPVTQPEYLRAIERDPELTTRLVVTPSGGISISQRRR